MANFDSPIRANVKVYRVFKKDVKIPHTVKMPVVSQVPDEMSETGEIISFKEQKTFRDVVRYVTESRTFIEYGPGTDQHLGRITAWVEDLRPEADFNGARPRTEDPHSAIGNMKRVSWEAMLPHIEAFERNESVKVFGVPLNAWPDLDEARLGVFQQYGLRSVEELVNAPESVMIKIAASMPDCRRWQEKGDKHLKALATGATNAQLAARDGEIADLKAKDAARQEEIEEMRAMMQQLLNAKIEETGDEPKRRGRPPKMTTEDAAA